MAALSGATQVAQAATKEAVGPESQPRTTVADLPSIITVEVVGYETTDGAAGPDDGAPRPPGSEERRTSAFASSPGSPGVKR